MYENPFHEKFHMTFTFAEVKFDSFSGKIIFWCFAENEILCVSDQVSRYIFFDLQLLGFSRQHPSLLLDDWKEWGNQSSSKVSKEVILVRRSTRRAIITKCFIFYWKWRFALAIFLFMFVFIFQWNSFDRLITPIYQILVGNRSKIWIRSFLVSRSFRDRSWQYDNWHMTFCAILEPY